MNLTNQKLKLSEKFGYALGDGAANIAWRGVSTFLLIFYTDVFGINPAAVGLLLLIARFSDGVSDIAMGIIGDRTNTVNFVPGYYGQPFLLGLFSLFYSPARI
jgi:GPH family glycoside/pentoside/hexuronide:cation symporter